MGSFSGGAPFLASGTEVFRPRNHAPLSPATRAWQPGAVTTRYLLVDVLAGLLLVGLYFLIPAAAWEFAFMPTLILSDTLWRVGGPLILAATLLVRWRHAPRLLGLTKKPVVRAHSGDDVAGFSL